MVKSVIASALLAGAFAAPAFAQEGPEPSAGFRVEAIGGYESTAFWTNVFDTSPGPADDREQGFVYGLGIGYDLAAGRMRFGLEAEASDSTASDCFDFDLTDICVKTDHDLYVGARAGGMISSNVLLYAKGGYTNIRQTATFKGPIAEDPGSTVHRKFDGLRLGGGAEVAVGRNLFVKAEYRYSNYEAKDSFNKHQGVIGVGLRF